MSNSALSAAHSVLSTAQKVNYEYQLFFLRAALAVDCYSLVGSNSNNNYSHQTIGDAINNLCSDGTFPSPEYLLDIWIRGVSHQDPSLQQVIESLDNSPYALFSLQFKTLFAEFSSSRLYKDAIKFHPTVNRLYHKAFSEHILQDIKHPLLRLRTREVTNSPIINLSSRKYYFSPALQISIGHYQHLTKL